MIDATTLSVRIGKRQVLHGVEFSARPGALTAIIGPNGSGKTTLMRALCADIAYAGTVRLNGHDLRQLRPDAAATMRGVLPQASLLSFPFTVYEVVRMGLSAGLAGLDPARAATLPEEALERVDLAGFGGRFYPDLSGGEQQRVQLARVLCQVWEPVRDGVPRLLLLDEPVSSLDIRHQLLIMDLARRFADAGGGVVAILHDLNLAALYADEVVAMADGRIVAHGSPAEVLAPPLIRTVFGCELRILDLGAGGRLFAPPQPAVKSAA